MKIHDLKCWPEYFATLKSGEKTFELRQNDRSFRAGEIIRLREWDPIDGYNNAQPPITFEITHVMYGPKFGLQVGFAALALRPCEPPIEPLAIECVGRVMGEATAISVGLSREATDDELRSIHDWLREWRLP